MTANEYLHGILNREAVDTSKLSPVRGVQGILDSSIREWAGPHLRRIAPSGSFAKGTANKSGTDIDLFISLYSTADESMRNIYNTLFNKMSEKGLNPKKQNVSINVRVRGQDVDLVPARQQNAFSEDHTLYRRRADTWTKTNIDTHISTVRLGGCLQEIRLLKLWRNQKNLDFPSFYLELIAIEALKGNYQTLPERIFTCFRYLRDTFPNARVSDPANTANIISNDLSVAEKSRIKIAAETALAAKTWGEIVR